MKTADRALLRDFGKMVRECRRANGLSIDALAKKSGVSAPRLRALESGREDPSLIDITNIAEGLGMEPSVVVVRGADAKPRGARPANRAGIRAKT